MKVTITAVNSEKLTEEEYDHLIDELMQLGMIDINIEEEE